MSDARTRRAALGALASVPALALPVAAIAADSATADVPPKEVATIAEASVVDFESWEHTADEWTPPGNEEWLEDSADVFPSIRMAWIAMYKTKAELEKLSRDLDGDALNFMLDGISHARKYFTNFVTILHAAEVRIICAAASAVAKDDPERFAREA